MDFTDPTHSAIQELESWVSSLKPFARNSVLGRIDDLLDAAARGELEDTGDERTPIAPIRRDPEIYELRHKSLNKKLRFYHGEPSELPDALVALHRHVKTDGADQERQIVAAVQRYKSGRADLWESNKQP